MTGARCHKQGDIMTGATVMVTITITITITTAICLSNGEGQSIGLTLGGAGCQTLSSMGAIIVFAPLAIVGAGEAASPDLLVIHL